MTIHNRSIEDLSSCSFDSLLKETLHRLYERRGEIDRLIQSLELRTAKSGGRTLKSRVGSSQIENLRQAIERQQLVVHYQPKVSLRLRQLAGFEALVYWQHPKQGLISPAELIPLAEATGLMVPLGAWVLGQASRQLSLWRQEIPQAARLTMQVKLSSAELESDVVTDQVKSCFERYSLPADTLHVAVAEPSAQEHPDLALQVVEKLKRLAVNVWLDDFRADRSSLNQLGSYPLSGLKIDCPSLLDTEQSDALLMSNAIFALSRKLGLRIAADGIQTTEEADELERLGCEFGQGTLFSKPVPAGVATRFILADSFGLLGRSKHGPRPLSNWSGCPPPLPA